MSVAHWWEITDLEPEESRFAALSETLRAAGVENQYTAVRASAIELGEKIREARERGVRAVRLGGSLPDEVLGHFGNLPSLMLTLKSADSLCVDDAGRLWPRNFLQEGLTRMIASDLSDLDIGGAAFVIGATPAARASVAALVRTGLKRVNLTDADEERGQRMLEDFRRSYFNVQFQFTSRGLVTQLPGVHSVAINAINAVNASRDGEGQLNELFYFNFLKAGGIWVEVYSTQAGSPLLQEARGAGAQVEPSSALMAHWDQAWVEGCFGRTFSRVPYRDELEKRLGMSSNLEMNSQS